jgi:uncharacterized protein (TIGR03067 family)
MRTYLGGFLGFAVVAGLTRAAPALEKDEEKIQGHWKVQSATVAGIEGPAEVLKKIDYSFKGDTVFRNCGATKQEGTFKLDASAWVKTIDIQSEKMLEHGIYKLDGDNLTICLGEPEEARPAEFESKAGSRRVLIVLTRVKD